MKLWIIFLVFVTAAAGPLFAQNDDPFSNRESFRRAIEQADCVAIVDVKDDGSIMPRLVFEDKGSDQPSSTRFVGGMSQAGQYLYIETSRKFDPRDIHSPYWGSDSVISGTTWNTWHILLKKGCLTLSDGRRFYMADLIGLIGNIRAKGK
jgi:hypothetical protein